MDYTKQESLLEQLGHLERQYAGLYPTTHRKFTVKWTHKPNESTKRPYLYTWVNWAEGETAKYSIEAGRVITRTNFTASNKSQQNVYICPVNGKNKELEMMYFTGADEKVIFKMQHLRDALEKQMKVLGKAFNVLRDQKNLTYQTLSEKQVFELEEETKETMHTRYPDLMNKGEKELEEIEEIIKKKELEKKMILMYQDQKEKSKEEKRMKREKMKAEKDKLLHTK